MRASRTSAVDEWSEDPPELCEEAPPGTALVAGAEDVGAGAGAAVVGGTAELTGGATPPGTTVEPGADDDAGAVVEPAPGAVEEAGSCAKAGRGADAAVAAQTSRTVANRRRIPRKA
jgi:hypothetical protein